MLGSIKDGLKSIIFIEFLKFFLEYVYDWTSFSGIEVQFLICLLGHVEGKPKLFLCH